MDLSGFTGWLEDVVAANSVKAVPEEFLDELRALYKSAKPEPIYQKELTELVAKIKQSEEEPIPSGD